MMSVSEDHRVYIWDRDVGCEFSIRKRRNYGLLLDSVWQETLPGYGPLTCCAGFADGGIAVGGLEGYLCGLKLHSKGGRIFLSSHSVQSSFYQTLQVAQDLESMGLA